MVFVMRRVVLVLEKGLVNTNAYEREEREVFDVVPMPLVCAYAWRFSYEILAKLAS